jgi:hypothetical protein
VSEKKVLMTRTNRSLGAAVALLGWVGSFGLGLAGCESGAGGELAVLNLEPRTGITQGSQAVRITGSNFRQDIGYTVYFGANRASQVTIMDDSTLLVATPSHDPGPVDVVIASDDGPAYRIVDGFTYAAAGAAPAAGEAAERF